MIYKHKRPPDQFADSETSNFDSMVQDCQGEVLKELERAIGKHPQFPIDPVQMIGIAEEEVGEAMSEAIEFDWKRNNDIGMIQVELEQAAAMCIRAIVALQILSDEGVYEE